MEIRLIILMGWKEINMDKKRNKWMLYFGNIGD